MPKSAFALRECLAALAVVVALGLGLWRLDAWLLDGLAGSLFASWGEDTAYAPGYSAARFRRVKSGMSEEEVVLLIGSPLRKLWTYELSSGSIERVIFKGDIVTAFTPREGEISRTLRLGLLSGEVEVRVGAPTHDTWIYSETVNDGSYRVRLVRFEDGRVVETIHKFYID